MTVKMRTKNRQIFAFDASACASDKDVQIGLFVFWHIIK